MATASGRSPGALKVSRPPGPFSSSARLRTRARQASILASSSPEMRYAGLRPAIRTECTPGGGRHGGGPGGAPFAGPRPAGPGCARRPPGTGGARVVPPRPSGRRAPNGSAPALGLLPARALDLDVSRERLVLGPQRADLLGLPLEPVEQLVGCERLVVAHVLAAGQQAELRELVERHTSHAPTLRHPERAALDPRPDRRLRQPGEPSRLGDGDRPLRHARILHEGRARRWN